MKVSYPLKQGLKPSKYTREKLEEFQEVANDLNFKKLIKDDTSKQL